METSSQNLLQAQLVVLLSDIRRWQKRTSGFRLFNVILFGIFRILTPVGSFVVAANVFAMAQGEAFLGSTATLLAAGIVAVVSGLDSILNPSSKKRIAFKMSNNLRTLANKVNVTSSGLDPKDLAKLLVEAGEEFRSLQNEYAEHGY